ncbi:allatotropin isoform X2 [Cephus cinctus]|nr:allatotropin isoform X2 [Cephus cinctus]XP_015590630.1 allatotropin isoform X2 [Cephus cinctus]
MRLRIILVLGFAGLLLAERSGSSSGYSHFVKHRTKPREIRGFKPEFLSTAIGFGKRESPYEGITSQDKNEKIILSLLQKFPQSVSLEWLFHEMRKNPELAKRIAMKIIAGDPDDKLSTVDLFKPERTISLL